MADNMLRNCVVETAKYQSDTRQKRSFSIEVSPTPVERQSSATPPPSPTDAEMRASTDNFLDDRRESKMPVTDILEETKSDILSDRDSLEATDSDELSSIHSTKSSSKSDQASDSDAPEETAISKPTTSEAVETVVVDVGPSTLEATSSASPLVSALASELESLKADQASAHAKLKAADPSIEHSETRLTYLRRSKQHKEDRHKRLIERWKLAYKMKQDNRASVDILTATIDKLHGAKSSREDVREEAAQEVKGVDQKVAEAQEKLSAAQRKHSLEERWKDPVAREFARSLGWGKGFRTEKAAEVTEAFEELNEMQLRDFATFEEQLDRISEEVKGCEDMTGPITEDAEDSNGAQGSDNDQPTSIAKFRKQLNAMYNARKKVESMLEDFAGLEKNGGIRGGGF